MRSNLDYGLVKTHLRGAKGQRVTDWNDYPSEKAAIVQQVGSWNKGTALTIRLRRVALLVDILDRLGKMPDVEDTREQPVTKHNSFGFLQKPIAKLRIRPRKKFLVTLKQTSPAKRLQSAELRAS